VENTAGQSIRVGEWHERDDGLWELRIDNVDIPIAVDGRFSASR